MNLASDRLDHRHDSNFLGSVVTSEFVDLAASPSVKVVTDNVKREIEERDRKVYYKTTTKRGKR